MYKFKDAYGDDEEAETMLEVMQESKVFEIEKRDDDYFIIWEGCDHFFSQDLTKDELLALAQELIDLANGVTNEKAE